MDRTSGRRTRGGRAHSGRERGAGRPAAGRDGGGTHRRARTWAVAAGIAVLTLLAFWPALGNGFVNWDDSGYVTENYLIRDLSPRGLGGLFRTFVEGNYHPVTMLSLAVDYRLWGLRPQGYHLTAVLLHVVATLLVYALGLVLTGSLALAAFAALFFGIHPMHVESVAWVSGRKDLLYAIFYLAGCLAWLRWIRRGRARCYAAALGAFLLSLLAKGMAVTFPVTLFLLDYVAERRSRLWRAPGAWRSLAEKLPFFALAALLGVVAVMAQKAKGALPPTPLPFTDRLFVAAYGLASYLVRAVAPLRLSAFYPYPANPGAPLPLAYHLAPLAVAALALAAVLAGRRSRLVAFGALFFLLNVVLVLQLFPVGSAVMADRYTYLSYAGLGLALAGALRLLGARSAAPARAAGAVALAACALALVLATRARCEVWATSDRLWSDVIATYPNVGMAYKNRAVAARDAGRDDAAAVDLERALALNPRDAEAWCNRGNVHFAKARYDSALRDLDTAIRLNARSPVSRNSRGAVYFSLGRLDRALPDFDAALALRDAYPAAHLNRGNTFSLLRRYDRALADYDAYLALEPGTTNANVFYWRGLAKNELGNPGGAIADFDAAIRLDANHAAAYYARALAREKRGDRAGALADARQARALGHAVDDAMIARLGGNRP